MSVFPMATSEWRAVWKRLGSPQTYAGDEFQPLGTPEKQCVHVFGARARRFREKPNLASPGPQFAYVDRVLMPKQPRDIRQKNCESDVEVATFINRNLGVHHGRYCIRYSPDARKS
jgi:hypothetical protein